MLADTPSPPGSGATLAIVGTLSEGFERSVASPLLLRRLRAMGCTVWSVLHAKQSFLTALQVAARDGTRGLIEFLLSRQSSSAALQVALRVRDYSGATSEWLVIHPQSAASYDFVAAKLPATGQSLRNLQSAHLISGQGRVREAEVTGLLPRSCKIPIAPTRCRKEAPG
jgi:hypothetical protein